MVDDITLNEKSAYGSISWAGQRLGMTKSQFLRKREILESEGFPSRDPLTNLYHKADVDAWIDRRRRIQDVDLAAISEARNSTEVNLDAL